MKRVDPKPADVCAGALLANLAEMFEEAAGRGAGLSFTVEATALFGRASREALHHVYALQMRAEVADEMEAVARDLDLIGHAKSGQIGPKPGAAVGPKMGELVDLREALASEQRVLQAALDAGQEPFIDLTRPENTNVVSFPGRTFQPTRQPAQQPALQPDGGDAA